jgi:hypothetical protein
VSPLMMCNARGDSASKRSGCSLAECGRLQEHSGHETGHMDTLENSKG